MKKLMFLLFVTLFISSCGCMIAQIPPQTVYVNEDCQAVLPDYLPHVTVTDNCELDTVYQFPEPGWILTSGSPTVAVTITAEDDWGNQSVMEFTVTAVDTIPPTIEPDSTFEVSIQQGTDLIKDYHRAVLTELIEMEETMPDSTVAMLLQASGNDHLYTEWYTDNLIVFCPAGGNGNYVSVFWEQTEDICFCDSTGVKEPIGF